MSQQEVSERSGVAVSRISQFENGRVDPSVDMLLRLLAATDHTIKLIDSADADFVNKYVNAIHLENVLDLVDALPGYSNYARGN